MVSISHRLTSPHALSSTVPSAEEAPHRPLVSMATYHLSPPHQYLLPAACYDSINHCVWTVSDDWVDVWSCAGRVRPAAHLLAVRMNHGSVSSLIPSPSQGAASTLRDTIDLLLRHSGMESCRLVPSQAFSRPVEHNLKLTFLRHVLSIVQCSVEEKSWNNVLANIITLQV